MSSALCKSLHFQSNYSNIECAAPAMPSQLLCLLILVTDGRLRLAHDQLTTTCLFYIWLFHNCHSSKNKHPSKAENPEQVFVTSDTWFSVSFLSCISDVATWGYGLGVVCLPNALYCTRMAMSFLLRAPGGQSIAFADITLDARSSMTSAGSTSNPSTSENWL